MMVLKKIAFPRDSSLHCWKFFSVIFYSVQLTSYFSRHLATVYDFHVSQERLLGSLLLLTGWG